MWYAEVEMQRLDHEPAGEQQTGMEEGELGASRPNHGLYCLGVKLPLGVMGETATVAAVRVQSHMEGHLGWKQVVKMWVQHMGMYGKS